MLLEVDTVSAVHNMLAGVSSWLLLAGFVSLPSTFTSVINSRALQTGAGKAGKIVVRVAQNVPLLAVAGACCAIGGLGMSCFWWIYQNNYVWLINRIFL